MYPFLLREVEEARLSTVDALERNPSGRRTIIRNDITSGSIRTTQGGVTAVHPQDVPAQSTTKRSPKGRIKSSTVAIYASVFALLVAVIAIGYRAPEQSSATVSATPVANVADVEKPAVNDVVATDIAASVAAAAELAVAPNVTELAISTRVQSQYQNQSTDDSTISKPVIVELSMASRNITSYPIAEGDTVASVAQKFGVSETTIRWANNLKDSDTIKAGATLEVLPVSGLAYTVKDGDTLQSIADKYKANAELIATYNDLEINGITTGLKIVIPNGVLPNEERPGYISPAIRYTSGFVTGVGAWGGNVISMQIFRGVDANSGGYAPGNCTAYAYFRRAQLGRPIPSQLGNAYTWATQARAFNYVVNSIPEAGAVIQSGNHVGIVEEIYPNGDLRITDMNYGYRLYNLAERVIPAASVSNYAFIH